MDTLLEREATFQRGASTLHATGCDLETDLGFQKAGSCCPPLRLSLNGALWSIVVIC